MEHLKKIKPVTFNNKIFKTLFTTKYDYLFKDEVRCKGIVYYKEHRVTNFNRDNNIISAIIKGTSNYNVSIEYLDNDELKVKCECPYHKDTNIYCKHIYTLLLEDKLKDEKQRMLDIYNNNTNRLIKIRDKIKIIVIDNKWLFDDSFYTWVMNNKYSIYSPDIINIYKDNIKELSNFARESYYKLNQIIEDYNIVVEKYNEIIDYLNKEPIKEEYDEPEEIEEDDVDIDDDDEDDDDDPLYQAIIDNLAGIDIRLLEEMRKVAIERKEETDMLDKAIERNKMLTNYFLKKKKLEDNLRHTKTSFGLMDLLFNDHKSSKKQNNKNYDYLMPWEQDLVDSGEYEPYHFEEEEMDEDDYYYEDE